MKIFSPTISGSSQTSGSLTISGSLNVSQGITGSLLGTASWAVSASNTTNSTTSSFALTASSVNTLNQNILITGNLTVGTASIGANENTLILGLPPAGGTGEGGQLLFQASGGVYTSASMLDNYQNQTRLLRGTNAGSDAVVASWNMHSKQMQLPAYNSTTAFTATTLVGILGFDANGNILTTNTSSGGGGGGVTILNNTDNYLITATGTANTLNGESNLQFNGSSLTITGNITASGTITAQANGQMYFRGGDDAELWDINVANTLGIYGQQDQGIASIKLGSGGGIISGRSGSIGIGITTPNSGALHVSGGVFATSFTGSLLGTSSWATNALTASFAPSYLLVSQTSSFVQNSQTSSFVQNSQTSSMLAPYVLNSQTSSFVQNSQTSSFVQNSQTSSFVQNSQTSSMLAPYVLTSVTSSMLAPYTLNSQTSSFVRNTQTSSMTVLSSSFAITASYALNGGVTSIAAGSGISINQSTGNVIITNASAGGATFPYTGSAIISGSLIVTGNLDTTQGGIDAIRIKETTLTNAGQYDRGVTLADTWSSSGPTLIAGRVVYLSGSGQWAEAVASATGSSTGVLGVVTTTANQNDIVLHGLVRVSQSLAGFTNGRPVYLSPLTAGIVTETPPSTVGQVGRYVGYIIDSASRQIYFNPDFTWIQL